MGTRKRSFKKVVVIANPKAGHGGLQRRWKRMIEPEIRQRFPNAEIYFTKHQGDATKATRHFLENDADLILIMGGDGSINECVNGFFNHGLPLSPHACLGIIPFGSGGDFIRTLQWPRDFRKALDRLKNGQVKKIDLGLVVLGNKPDQSRYFINIAEFGVGATIMKRVNRKNKKLPALWRYVSGSVQGFLDYKNVRVKLTLIPQAQFEMKLTNLIVANGRYFGRGMCPAPQAELDDGLFDVIVIKNMTVKRFLLSFPQLYLKKKNLPTALFESFRASQLEVELLNPKENLPAELDGETWGEGPLTVKMLPKVLNLVV